MPRSNHQDGGVLRVEPSEGTVRPMTVDVIVVAYNSAETIRECLEPLVSDTLLNVIVVDNASSDDSLAQVSSLGATIISLSENRGFAYGCNRGLEAGSAPITLFLNPDADITPQSVRRLATTLGEDETIGAVGPRIVNADGSLEHSQRRFPRLRTTYAQALFLHRVAPRAPWTDEMIRDPRAYATRHDVEWLSGACLMLRREMIEQIGGWDEGYFMYGEDKELCWQVAASGRRVVYEPAAEVLHIGGASRPRAELLPTLARSSLRYAHQHQTAGPALLTRAGVALSALTHSILTTKGSEARMGHLRSFGVACTFRDPTRKAPRTLKIRSDQRVTGQEKD